MLMMLAMAGVRDRTPAADAHDVCYGRVVGHNHGQLMLMMLAMRGYGQGQNHGQLMFMLLVLAGNGQNHGQLMLMMLATAGVRSRTMGNMDG